MYSSSSARATAAIVEALAYRARRDDEALHRHGPARVPAPRSSGERTSHGR